MVREEQQGPKLGTKYNQMEKERRQTTMENKWHEIWEKRQGNSDILANGNQQEIFWELKRINGFDVLDGGIAYEQLYLQYTQTKRELEYCPQLGSYSLQSIFEVGCGCGANHP